MKSRQLLLLGLAGVGFVLALPAQAALGVSTDVSVGGPAIGFVLAKRDDVQDKFESRRDLREEQRAKAGKNQQSREPERAFEPQDYGYGFERRQQPAHDDANRSRR